ncbi:DUF3089 domain-containing protein [Qipengyuania sp.]|uniref:DUF3089 domain-containing protein n=1 Tax=Qipengyuania sp. TaxID=2004515 RepID=UPI0035C873CD
MTKSIAFISALACLATGCAGATNLETSQAITAAAAPELYADADKWLCLPGRQDSCDQDLTTTVVAADGTLTREAFDASPDQPIDCFYIYPTLSLDRSGNADWNEGPEEGRVLHQQLARFADVCQVYAPKYRQITMLGVSGRSGEKMADLYRVAIADVKEAWNHYLANYSDGRGVILIGHSQGSRMLINLIQDEIDGKPSQERIVSAYLNGTSVVVPEGRDVGGTFTAMPLCRSADQTQCIVAYRSFRADSGPVNDYAATERPGMEIACVNPAAPGGGKASLHSYLTTDALMGGPKPRFVNDGPEIETPFASVPGLLSGECVSNESGQYLAISINADPSDPRTDDITGDIYTGGKINPAMGLHLIDINLVMGNLLDLARSQTRAYLAAPR